jgi:glutamate/tyrosine decarboxylase-like PLP-dependent enzyme
MTVSALFPDHDTRAQWDDLLTKRLAAATQRVSQGSVSPTFDPDAFTKELASYQFLEPVPFEHLLNWTVAQLEHGVVHMTHPRYLGLFNPAPSFPAQCADRIVGAFNPQLATATTSPAAVAIEAHVTKAVAQRCGLGQQAVGHFTSGGSEANFTAVICALTAQEPAYAHLGSRSFAGQPVFYISADSHLAWIKIAHQAGIGRSAARLVPTDGCGRMSLPALRAAIRADRQAGHVPFLIVATAGTTNAGMIDPLGECAEIAEDEGVWFHVDAAWGGGAIASDRMRPSLAGIERAHSVTIDAHKWFATTMGCGMFITTRPSVLAETFGVLTNFMPSHTPTLDPYVTTVQWSRRFLGLRLFLALAASGWDGYAKHVEHSVELGQLLANTVTAFGWAVVNTPALAVVCMTPPPGSAGARQIVQGVVASGGAWVSAGKFEGQDVVRACITHGQTSATDIIEVATILHKHAVA